MASVPSGASSPLLNFSFDMQPTMARSSSPTQYSLPPSLGSDGAQPRTSSRPCTACKEVHVACDKQRPCGRCRRLKKEAQCEDPPARRGRKEPGSRGVRHSSSERSSDDNDSPSPSPSLRTPPVPDNASPPSAPLRISQPLGDVPTRPAQALRLSQPLGQPQPPRPISRVSSSGGLPRTSTPPPRSGTPTSGLGYALDGMVISEQDAAAVAAAAAAVQPPAMAVGNSNLAVATVDGNLQIIAASREWCRTLGYDLREMLGLDLIKLHPSDLAAGYMWYLRIFVEETPDMQLLTSRMIELVWQTREGKELYLITRFDIFVRSRKVYSVNITLIGSSQSRPAPRSEHRAIYPPQLLSLQQFPGSASQTAAAWLPQQSASPFNSPSVAPTVLQAQQAQQPVMLSAQPQQHQPPPVHVQVQQHRHMEQRTSWHHAPHTIVPPLPPLPPPSSVTNDDELLPWEQMIKGI